MCRGSYRVAERADLGTMFAGGKGGGDGFYLSYSSLKVHFCASHSATLGSYKFVLTMYECNGNYSSLYFPGLSV